MATKRENIENPDSCLNKAADDEPIFVLRGKDYIAALIVRYWADQAFGIHEPEKIDAALRDAEVMQEWRRARFPDWGKR